MLNKVSWLVGRRYTLSWQHSHLLAFISRISVASLIVGVALLILVMSIMNGFDKELRERILQILPQATIYSHRGIENPDLIISQLKTHPEFVAAAPFVKLEGLLSHGAKVAPVGLFGIDPKLEPTTSTLENFLQENKLPALTELSQGIILGAELARTLTAGIGDTLTLILPRSGSNRGQSKISRLTIIDILNSGTEIDNKLALMNITAASALYDYPGRVSGIRVQVHDLFRASQTIFEMSRTLPPGFYGTDWTRTHGNLYQAIKMSKKLVSLLLFLLVAIAAFNLVSTLIMVVVDKQGDIAILRTLGASTREIIGIFIVQGGLIGAVGVFGGILLGVLLSYVVTPFIAWLESVLGVQFLHSDVYPVSYLPSELLWSDVFVVGVTALLLSFIASLYPAWRASRVLPAEALRYE